MRNSSADGSNFWGCFSLALSRVAHANLPVIFALSLLSAGGCRDRGPSGDETRNETKGRVAKQAEVAGAEALATTAAAGPTCTAAGDPAVGVDIGYNCTGALTAATFTHALCACGTIQDSNSLTTDGFDSSKGGPTGGLGGDVAANTGISWSTASSIGGTLWTPGTLNSSNTSTVRTDLHLGGTLSGSGLTLSKRCRASPGYSELPTRSRRLRHLVIAPTRCPLLQSRPPIARRTTTIPP